MIFEKIGKFCFPEKRALLFSFALLLPLFFSCLYALFQYHKMSDLEILFQNSCKKGKVALMKKNQKENFLHRYSNANPYFLDTYIETLSFLNEEKIAIKKLLNHPALADVRTFESRLDFLTKEQNRLSFTEEAIRSNSTMKEVEEKQRFPVQMDGEDVKKLLSLLEDVKIENNRPTSESRPQIVITDFRIEKKLTPIKTTVFEVEMQFLKREFFQ